MHSVTNEYIKDLTFFEYIAHGKFRMTGLRVELSLKNREGEWKGKDCKRIKMLANKVKRQLTDIGLPERRDCWK